ncbi:MAG: type VII secretion protein EccB [Streptosporangiales bacterium]|nr:type VII secretion protein EccB [Streptosporangiales bacterium]
MPPTQTQNRKDLLQAYRLMTQRSALALIAGEPDSPNQPLRRRTTATVSGILVALIACVLFGIMGAMHILGSPEGNLSQPGTLVIDKDTGTSYVPCEHKGEICPALNYTSALLALKNGSPSKKSVSQQQLSATQIGPTIGIAGLPQDLPASSNLVKGPWAVCDNVSGTSTTLVGGKAVGGTPLTGSTANLVQSQGQDYVLLNGQKMQIPARYMPLTFRGSQPQKVPAAWLNAVPAGPDFAPPAMANFGKASPNTALPGKIGQVFTTSTGPTVLGPDGKLHSVSGLQSLLLQEEPGAEPSQSVPSSTASDNTGPAEPRPGGLPTSAPHVAQVSAPVCVTYAGGGKHAITAGGTVPANPTSTGSSSPTAVNDVWMPPGSGALIGMTSGSGTASASSVASWCLLSGATRYGMSGSGVASDLGYDLSKDETILPASLVSGLPAGQGLDPEAAAQRSTG